MTDPTRSAFGRLIVDPDRLDFRGRVDVLRWLSGHLQAEPGLEARWLGRVLRAWLDGEDADLVRLLGLRVTRGCRVTAQAIVRQARHDAALVKAVKRAGSTRKACDLVTEGPRSPASITRARKRRTVSCHRDDLTI